jgi:heme exporter protein D
LDSVAIWKTLLVAHRQRQVSVTAPVCLAAFLCLSFFSFFPLPFFPFFHYFIISVFLSFLCLSFFFALSYMLACFLVVCAVNGRNRCLKRVARQRLCDSRLQVAVDVARGVPSRASRCFCCCE